MSDKFMITYKDREQKQIDAVIDLTDKKETEENIDNKGSLQGRKIGPTEKKASHEKISNIFGKL